jgi:hypothetical protein
MCYSRKEPKPTVMKLVYFSKKEKSWVYSEHSEIKKIQGGACLHNVTFVVIHETWEEIWRRIGLGVPTHDAMQPHAFLLVSCVHHISQFGKDPAKATEIVYNFQKGIFTHNDRSDKTVTSAQSVLITHDGKVLT